MLLFSGGFCAAQQQEIDSLSQLLKPGISNTDRVDLFNELAFNYVYINVDSALSYAERSESLAEEIDYKKGIAVAYARFGSAYFSKAEDDLSLEYYLKALKLSNEIGDSTNLSVVYQGLGIMYDILGQEEKALDTLTKALGIAQRLNQEKYETHIYLSLSVVSLQLDQFEDALRYVRESLEISRAINYANGVIGASNFLATIYLEQGKDEEALEYLNEALELSKTSGNFKRANYALIRIGRIYTNRGEYDKAREVLNEAVEIVEGTNLTSHEQDAYEHLYVLDTLEGNYPLAFEHFMKNEALKDTIFNTQTAKRMRELTARHEAEKAEQRIALLERDQQIKRLWRNILIAGIISIVALAIVILYFQRIRNRREQKFLGQKIEFQSKELASYTINFIQKRKLFDRVEDNLKEMEKSVDHESIPKIKRIRNLIKQKDNIDRDWDEFKLYFENVHKDFFNVLKSKHPEVSGSDLKLCALIKLNMSIKEMSSILGISPDSVKTARHRLRKKFNLDQSVNLYEYVTEMEKSIS